MSDGALTPTPWRASQQFFKEANDTYSNLQKEHETVRKNFPCNKNTSLEDLLELLRGLEVSRCLSFYAPPTSP